MRQKKNGVADWQKAEKAAQILKTVAHPVRLKVVDLLEQKDMTVGEIQNALGISQSLTSQQLSLMKSRGILKSHRVGKLMYYSIEMPEVLHILACLRKC
jgi:ArsR family transcriptional regulator, virulence genes transcriptional regulator